MGVESVDPDVMRQPPRNSKEPIISLEFLFNMFLSVLVIVGGTGWVFWSCLSDGEVTARDTTMV